MDSARDGTANDIKALKAALVIAHDKLVAEASRAVHAEAELAVVQARRGYHRDAGSDSEILEGDPARPREVHLPGLREDQPGASAVSHHRPRLGGAKPAGDGAVREIWPASAAQPAGGALCQR